MGRIAKFAEYLREELARTAEEPGLFLKVIIWDRLLKGALLFVLAVGLASLIHKDLGAVLLRIATAANLDVDSRYVAWLIHEVAQIKPRQMLGVSVAAFAYSALCFVEAAGLHLRRRWAEYLTALATTLFIPFEVFEIYRRPTPFRIATLVLNAAIVAYLVKSKELFAGLADRALSEQRAECAQTHRAAEGARDPRRDDA